jgi:hypothetical protein
MRTNFLKGSNRERMGRTHPFLQVVAGPAWAAGKTRTVEGFFEVGGAYNRHVPLHQRRRPLFLIVAEIPRILQQQPSAALEGHLLFLTLTAHFTAPDFFDRIVEVLDDVEPVEQDLRLGACSFTR